MKYLFLISLVFLSGCAAFRKLNYAPRTHGYYSQQRYNNYYLHRWGVGKVGYFGNGNCMYGINRNSFRNHRRGGR